MALRKQKELVWLQVGWARRLHLLHLPGDYASPCGQIWQQKPTNGLDSSGRAFGQAKASRASSQRRQWLACNCGFLNYPLCTVRRCLKFSFWLDPRTGTNYWRSLVCAEVYVGKDHQACTILPQLGYYPFLRGDLVIRDCS